MLVFGFTDTTTEAQGLELHIGWQMQKIPERFVIFSFVDKYARVEFFGFDLHVDF
jgi:hypothetical protein